MKITNNGGGSYCVGSTEPGVLLLNLKPGVNDIDETVWDSCKDRPVIKAAVRSGRLIPGGNPGDIAPAKASILMNETHQRAGIVPGVEKPRTPHETLVDQAKQEKTDHEAHPTLAMPENEALAFIAACDDKTVLEACFDAFAKGKDTRPAVKDALEKRAEELSKPDDTPSSE